MSVNHQHLRAFLAVASEGSFSRAARRLNISQPTLSQQIKALESRHGQMLFEGRRRPLQLTPVGRDLLALTQRMFATSQEIDDLLDERKPSDTAFVRLAADSPTHAVRLVAELLRTEPGLDVEIHIDNSHATLVQLLEARADVAIVSDPQIDPRLVYKPLFIDHLMAVVPTNHALAALDCIPLQALGNECLLLREATSKTRAAIMTVLRTHEVTPRRTIELHSREAIREAVACNIGVSLFFSSECPPDVRLAVRPIEHQPDRALLTGYIVCSFEQRRTPLIRTVLQAATRIEQL
ncbi:LysR family transcriptional regulator [Novosphingobium sp. FKTRR1]|uniref:LysR family transcriptional regulator n=1 Tax=unclassified Novosphingobium TaxID=2644732 RepID=UPI001CF02405|nr:LysR family transcriptional regulator [Novosphingobium sp. FKTRR1]